MQNYPILDDNTTIDKAISKNKPLHPFFGGLLLTAILFGFHNLLAVDVISVLFGPPVKVNPLTPIVARSSVFLLNTMGVLALITKAFHSDSTSNKRLNFYFGLYLFALFFFMFPRFVSYPFDNDILHNIYFSLRVIAAPLLLFAVLMLALYHYNDRREASQILPLLMRPLTVATPIWFIGHTIVLESFPFGTEIMLFGNLVFFIFGIIGLFYAQKLADASFLLQAMLVFVSNLLAIAMLSRVLSWEHSKTILFISLIVACLYIVGNILLERFTVHKKNT